MACACGAAGGSCTCEATVLSGTAYAQTLGARLASTVDCARNISTQMGLRPYQVQLVWTRWSDGKRGEGVEDVCHCLPITPTPLVTDMSQVRLSLRPQGIIEDGSVRITEISPRFDEDLLVGKIDGNDIDRDVSFYWEIRFPRANGQAVRRRFRIAAVPVYHAGKFQWHVDLQKVSEDRDRSGEPQGA